MASEWATRRRFNGSAAMRSIDRAAASLGLVFAPTSGVDDRPQPEGHSANAIRFKHLVSLHLIPVSPPSTGEPMNYSIRFVAAVAAVLLADVPFVGAVP